MYLSLFRLYFTTFIIFCNFISLIIHSDESFLRPNFDILVENCSHFFSKKNILVLEGEYKLVRNAITITLTILVVFDVW